MFENLLFKIEQNSKHALKETKKKERKFIVLM
jgi:hypothetical protein